MTFWSELKSMNKLSLQDKPSPLTLAKKAEYAYQLGPRELAVFWLTLKTYDKNVTTETYGDQEPYHYYQSTVNPYDYVKEEFIHFAETMAVKGHPAYKRKFLVHGFELAVQFIGKQKWDERLTVQVES